MTNPPKPKESLEGQTCPSCNKGHFALVQVDHTEEIPDAAPLQIPGLWVERCDHCGEIVFPAETTRFIESLVAEHTDQLTARELERIREDLGVARQDEMSEILGLGGKTWHKWESGAQFATRSMTYYIRLVAEFPQAFEWLRNRGWRAKNRIAQPELLVDFENMFPDLAASQQRDPYKVSVAYRRHNPALGLTNVTFQY